MHESTVGGRVRRGASAAMVALALSCQGSLAAAVRDNPFLPDTTAAEDKRIADDNAAATQIRELTPELVDLIQKRMERQQHVELDAIKQQMLDAQAASQAKIDAKVSAVNAAGINALRSQVAPAPSAAGKKFLFCVGDKPYYKDAGGAPVLIPPTSSEPSPC